MLLQVKTFKLNCQTGLTPGAGFLCDQVMTVDTTELRSTDIKDNVSFY